MLIPASLNTKKGLATQIGTYEGLYRVILERWKLSQVTGSKLKPFVFYGRIVSEENGGVNIYSPKFVTDQDCATLGPIVHGSTMLAYVEDVIKSLSKDTTTFPALREILNNLPALILAPPESLCTRCGKGWTLEDAHAISYSYSPPLDENSEMYPDPPDHQAKQEHFTYMHRRCREEELAEIDANAKMTIVSGITDAFIEAGFEDVHVSWIDTPEHAIERLKRAIDKDDNEQGEMEHEVSKFIATQQSFDSEDSESLDTEPLESCDTPDFTVPYVKIQTKQGDLGAIVLEEMAEFLLDLTGTDIRATDLEDQEHTDLFPLICVTHSMTLKRIFVLMNCNKN